MAKIVTFLNFKGGSAKTTTLAALAPMLSELGNRVLLIDMDRQNGTSKRFPMNLPAPDAGVLHLLETGQAEQCVATLSIGCDLIPNLTKEIVPDPVEEFLRNQMNGTFRLKIALMPLQNKYDYIFIDTGGGETERVNAALLASDYVVSPVVASAESASEFGANALILNSLKQSYEPLNQWKCPPWRCFMTCIKNNNNSKAIAENFDPKDYAHTEELDVELLNTRIPDRTIFDEARVHQMPVHLMEERVSGTRVPVRELLADLLFEIFPELDD